MEDAEQRLYHWQPDSVNIPDNRALIKRHNNERLQSLGLPATAWEVTTQAWLLQAPPTTATVRYSRPADDRVCLLDLPA